MLGEEVLSLLMDVKGKAFAVHDDDALAPLHSSLVIVKETNLGVALVQETVYQPYALTILKPKWLKATHTSFSLMLRDLPTAEGVPAYCSPSVVQADGGPISALACTSSQRGKEHASTPSPRSGPGRSVYVSFTKASQERVRRG